MLILFSLLFTCEIACFADLMQIGSTAGYGVRPDQLLLENFSLHSYVLTGQLTIEDPSRAGEIHAPIIDDPLTPEIIDYTGADNPSPFGFHLMVDNANVASLIFAIADSSLSGVAYLDHPAGPHGLFDSDGTVVTISDPATGGGKVNVGINSSGQIVGIVNDRHGALGVRSRAVAPMSTVAEPKTWPVLAGGVVIFVIAIRKTRPRNHVRRIVYSSSRLGEKRMTLPISAGSDCSASSAS